MNDTYDEDGTAESATGSPQGSSRLRRSRLAAIGLVTGLVAAIGAGVVTMAQDEPAVAKSVTGEGRLPWDDAASDGVPFADRSGPGNDGPGRHLPGRMHDHMDGPDGRRGGPQDGPDFAGGLRGPRAILEVIAEELGTEVADLVAELRNGASIADIAKEKNVDVQGLIDSLVERVTAEARERITELVNRTPDTTKGPDTTKE